jgi:hypothetical protein
MIQYSYVGYLTTLPVTRLYTVDDKMINERGAVGGIKMGRANLSPRRQADPMTFCPLQITPCPVLGSNPGQLRWKPAINRLSYGTADDESPS